jgi:hypothetical protein
MLYDAKMKNRAENRNHEPFLLKEKIVIHNFNENNAAAITLYL